MSDHTCLYCEASFDDPRKRVCDEHKLHHRRVLYFRRQGRELPLLECVDCGVSIGHKMAKALRCDECIRIKHAEDERARKASAYGPKPARECEYCGKPIGAERRRDARFCDRDCLERYRTENVDRSQYYRSTQKQRTEYTRAWRKSNPASTRTSKRRRAYRELTGTISERDWSRLVARHRGQCAYCGGSGEMTMDHVVPLSRGGTNTIGNVLPACRSCNSSKHMKLLVEWRARKAAMAA